MESVTGFAAYLALYLSVVTGIGLSSRWGRRRLVRLRLGGSHEALSLCGLALGIMHAMGSRLVWAVPFLAPSPGMAVGGLALDLGAVVTVSFYLRRRLGSPAWRWVHALAYPAFAFAAWHALAVGANAWIGGVEVSYAATLGSVGALALLRVGEALRRGRRLSPTA